jgi:putative methylase
MSVITINLRCNRNFNTIHNFFSGIDVMFLEKAIRLAKRSVYSLHKTSTRHHIERKAKQNNAKMEVLAELKFNLDASYKFHKRKSVDIEVDFIRFDVSEK